jgi:hypothetical protein
MYLPLGPSAENRTGTVELELARLWIRYRLASQAQLAAFGALVVFAALAASMGLLDRPWLASLFGAFDVATVVGLFLTSGHPGELGDPSQEVSHAGPRTSPE